MGVSTSMVGFVTAVPYVVALIVMNLWSWHSDRSGERVWHMVGGWALETVALGACVFIGPSQQGLLMLALIAIPTGSWAVAPIFWTIPSALLTGTAAAGGIALINSVGQLGAWFGPWLYGLARDVTGTDTRALLCFTILPVVCALLLLAVGHDRRLERIPTHR
jgi:nitrate/nitrite transporter NarK